MISISEQLNAGATNTVSSVYYVSYDSSTLHSIGTVNTSTGAATKLFDITLSTGQTPTDIARDSSGNFYVTSWNNTQATLNITKFDASGTKLATYTSNVRYNSLTIADDGTMYGSNVDGASLYKITFSGTTMTSTLVGSFGSSVRAGGDLVYLNGDIYNLTHPVNSGTTNYNISTLVKYNLATGTVTTVATSTMNVYGLALGADGKLYASGVTGQYGSDDTLLSIDLTCNGHYLI